MAPSLKIRDEYLFLDELSLHLSQRYQRPTSSIFINLDHSACLLFAGTFDSAYVLTITALPSQLLPTTNKRNTALIQSHMASSLGVLPDRGIIHFVAIADGYLATKGTTYSGHIERLQKKSSDESKRDISPPNPTEPKKEILPPNPLELKRRISPPKPQEPMTTDSILAGGARFPMTDNNNNSHNNKSFEATRIVPHLTPDKPRKGNRQSLLIHATPASVPIPTRRFQSAPQSQATSPTLQKHQPILMDPMQHKSPPIPSIPWDNNPMDRKAAKVQRLGRRRSFWSVFGRSTHA